MIKSFKIRIYPTKEQEAKMWQHIGSCRFIWNYMLDLQQRLHEQGEKHLSAYDMFNYITPLKKEEDYEWLSQVSTTSLRCVCQDLDKAYKGFFNKTSGFPKFKSRKRSKPNFPICAERFYFESEYAQIQKLGKVKYKTDFDIPQGKGFKFTNPRISNQLGKWILSFGMECENQAPELSDKLVGIDLGIKELAVVAHDGEPIVFHNINKSKRVRELKHKLKHLQRRISRKYEASRKRTGAYEKTKNIEKEEEKLRKLHGRLANIRQNYTHQTTHKIVSLLPKRVTMEDLNVAGMMKNRHLVKSIAEQTFNEFIRQMRYKCEWNGIEFVQVDRFYPSSKTCSCCGTIKQDLKLKDRVFKCVCGFELDRDFNAALNLSRYVA